MKTQPDILMSRLDYGWLTHLRLFGLIACVTAALGYRAEAQTGGAVCFKNSSPAYVYVGTGTATKATTALCPTVRLALYWGPSGSTSNQLVQISTSGVAAATTNGLIGFNALQPGLYGSSITYYTGAATPVGSNGVFQVRAWDSAYGATWERFVNNSAAVGALCGQSGLMTVTTVLPPTMPANVPGSDATNGPLHLLPYDGSWQIPGPQLVSRITGGGGASSSANFALTGSIGQGDAGGTLHGTNFSLAGGLWGLITVVQTPGLPQLTVSYSGTGIQVSWPNTGNYTLQQRARNTGVPWVNSSYPITTANGTNSIIITTPSGRLYFRLAQ